MGYWNPHRVLAAAVLGLAMLAGVAYLLGPYLAPGPGDYASFLKEQVRADLPIHEAAKGSPIEIHPIIDLKYGGRHGAGLYLLATDREGDVKHLVGPLDNGPTPDAIHGTIDLRENYIRANLVVVSATDKEIKYQIQFHK